MFRFEWLAIPPALVLFFSFLVFLVPAAEPLAEPVVEEQVLPFAKAVQRPRKLQVSLQDPDDRKFLECAVEGRAGHVVSGDKHLLTLGSFRGIPIVPAAEYLRFLQDE